MKDKWASMRHRLRLKILTAKYGGRLSVKFTKIAGKLIKSWKFLRNYPVFLSDVYFRLEKIAKQRNIEIPTPLMDMELEGE